MGEPIGTCGTTTGDAFPFILVALDADGALSDTAAVAAPSGRDTKSASVFRVGGCGPQAGTPLEGQE